MPGSLLKLSLLALLVWGLLSLAGVICLRPITTAMIPVVESVVDGVQSDYVSHISLVESGTDPKLLMSCTLTHRLMRPGQTSLPPLNSFACAWTDAIHAVAPVVAFLVPVIAWPMHRRREGVARLLLSIPLLIGVVAMTTPVLLLGLAQQSLYPDASGFATPLRVALHPFIFEENGGDWLVALTAAAAAIRAGLAVCARRSVGGSGSANEAARAVQ